MALRLDWAVPCRYAEAASDATATIIGGGIDSFWTEVPGDIAVFLMLRVVGPPDEFEDQHELEIRLVTPRRDEHQVLAGNFVAEPGSRNPLAVPGMEGGSLIPVGVAFTAEEHGLYTLEIYLDTQRLRSIPIAVRSPEELQQQPSA